MVSKTMSYITRELSHFVPSQQLSERKSKRARISRWSQSSQAVRLPRPPCGSAVGVWRDG